MNSGDHVTVKKTPDLRVSESIAQALAKWVSLCAGQFQPKPVKVLIGIPLN